MHYALRPALALAALLAVLSLTACETQDRRIYSDRTDKNLHTPGPWAPSTTRAADDATSSLELIPGATNPPDTASPSAPPMPPAQ